MRRSIDLARFSLERTVLALLSKALCQQRRATQPLASCGEFHPCVEVKMERERRGVACLSRDASKKKTGSIITRDSITTREETEKA